MSLRNKLIAAATRAVEEERGRILWLLQKMEDELKAALEKKLLVESERHALKVKLTIFRSVTGQLRRGIVSGVRPPDPEVPDFLPLDPFDPEAR